MKAMTLRFEVEKETKNTVRFFEVVSDGDEPQVGTLYVPKSELGEYRGALSVTLKPVK